ncbi:MarR family transcriptional regulator [Calothrix sp. 336/3]|uniref:MarR family transcriptional regulator n=1 Tax=Calothrix sp. 336/3 TaxID=1337936 RepID=UPI0004E35733|nr:helix-turn-helix domain-containing protein [Calothrix sp. 336/3]AKG24877.1 hypothetical protein IJ00_26330 [Calothrix sp. 336/3]
MNQLKKDKAPLFYQLTNEEWVETVKDLTGAEIKVLYYLRSLDPFGDRELDCSVTQIAIKLGLSKGAVSKALKRLDQMGLIAVELVRVKVRIKTGNNNVTEFPKENSVSYRKRKLPIGNDSLPEETEVSYSEQPLPIRNNQEPEVLPDEDFSTSKTIKTYSDFIKTLSEEERAKFLEFCQEKTKNLSQEVNDIEAWLAHKNKAGANRWEVYYEKFVLASQQKKNQSEQEKNELDKRESARRQFAEWQRELEESRLRGRKSGQEQAQNQSSGGET